MGHARVRLKFVLFSFLFLICENIGAQPDDRPPTVAGQALGALNLYQVRVPTNQCLVVALTKNLTVFRFPNGSSYFAETVPGSDSDILVTGGQLQGAMPYPGGIGTFISYSPIDLERLETRLYDIAVSKKPGTILEFKGTFERTSLITFNTASSAHWEGLVYLGIIGGVLLNTFGFKLLASGIFDRGADFASYASVMGVVASLAMTPLMAKVLRRQVERRPTSRLRRIATAVIVPGSIGICAGIVGVVGLVLNAR